MNDIHELVMLGDASTAGAVEGHVACMPTAVIVIGGHIEYKGQIQGVRCRLASTLAVCGGSTGIKATAVWPWPWLAAACPPPAPAAAVHPDPTSGLAGDAGGEAAAAGRRHQRHAGQGEHSTAQHSTV